MKLNKLNTEDLASVINGIANILADITSKEIPEEKIEEDDLMDDIPPIEELPKMPIIVTQPIHTNKGEYINREINNLLAVPNLVFGMTTEEAKEALPQTESLLVNAAVSLLANLDNYSEEEVISTLGAPPHIAAPLIRMGYSLGVRNALIHMATITHDELMKFNVQSECLIRKLHE